MSPDELRAAADRSALTGPRAYGVTADQAAADCEVLAAAARRLADVIEQLKLATARPGSRWAGRRAFARDVLNRVSGDFHTFDAARGETTNHENRSE